MKKILSLVFAALTIALITTPALAQQNSTCADRAQIIEQLGNIYGETRQSIGLGGDGIAIEVFASLETGTWTIISTRPDGLTCVLAAGDGFERTENEILPSRWTA